VLLKVTEHVAKESVQNDQMSHSLQKWKKLKAGAHSKTARPVERNLRVSSKTISVAFSDPFPALNREANGLADYLFRTNSL
jgi:hypothetical protein